MQNQKDSKFLKTIGFILGNFGPLISFYSFNHFYGLRGGIIASTIWSLSEITWKISRGQKLTGIFKFTAIMTFTFGMVDLVAQNSILFKYEASATNFITGIFFGKSLFDKESLIEEFYQNQPDASPLTPELRSYLRFFTALWVAFFFLKSLGYIWIARTYTIEQGLLVRSVAGTGSFVVMFAISVFLGKPIFLLCRRLGFFKESS